MNATLDINGRPHTLELETNELLVDVLRDKLHLYGTKKGCGTGECGACSILMDGEVVNSCLIFAVRAQGRKIVTIEGLPQDGKLTRLLELFIEHAAVQCGYCGPGMILAAAALLRENPHPGEAEIREGIAGNICRCSGYVNIVRAIAAASGELEAKRDES